MLADDISRLDRASQIAGIQRADANIPQQQRQPFHLMPPMGIERRVQPPLPAFGEIPVGFSRTNEDHALDVHKSTPYIRPRSANSIAADVARALLIDSMYSRVG